MTGIDSGIPVSLKSPNSFFDVVPRSIAEMTSDEHETFS
jgi:hypothetical protein